MSFSIDLYRARSVLEDKSSISEPDFGLAFEIRGLVVDAAVKPRCQ